MARLLCPLWIVLLCHFFIHPIPAYGQNSAQGPPDSVQIRYHLPEAGEVFLLWGINGWGMVPETTRPAGTQVKYGMMYTSMVREGQAFAAKVRAPGGATLDFVFHITRTSNGTGVDLWDTNGAPKRDYHQIAHPGEVIDIQGKLRPVPADAVKRHGYPDPLLLLWAFILMYAFYALLKRLRREGGQEAPTSSAVKVLCTGVSLALLLLLIRARMMGLGWGRPQEVWILGLDFLAAGYYDLLYAGAMTALFLLLLVPVRKKIQGQRLIQGAYLGVCLFALLTALINAKVVPLLGNPFTFQWLYYSDFLGSFDTRKAVWANISFRWLGTAAGLSLALVIASLVFRSWFGVLQRKKHGRRIAFALIAALLIYFPLANGYISKRSWDRSKLANALTFFLQSVLVSRSHPVLFTMNVPAGYRDFPAAYSSMSPSPMAGRNKPAVRNVVILVLESVPREYLQAYGAPYPATPELNKYLPHSALFENIYSHAPATNKALVPLLCSIYPWISYLSLTQEHPRIRIPSLSQELKTHGYRTAFFNAGDNRFQGTEAFLAHHQLDRMEDQRSMNCGRQRFDARTEGWSFLEGLDDECLLDAFIEWMKPPSDAPFFALFWTYMTHYPYFVVGRERNFEVRETLFNRYLNSLAHDDKVIGKLLRFLEERKLLDSTLVVVVGDHGEAFGQHGQFVHATRIYDENLHVPLILINPKLFRGEKYPVTGGLIDLAPTIMEVLHFPSPADWQGRSLFSRERQDRVYFFAPWSNFLFGFREGNWKFIYDATNNRHEVYDLLADPKEMTNLADRMPEFVAAGQFRLAAWVQYQDKFMKARFAGLEESR